VLILACIALDPSVKPTLTTGASIYPAVQNIMLAARALGIGSCLTTIHRFRDAQVKELLGIPADVETAALIPLGYPLGKFGRPPRRPVREVAFAESWGKPL
jgi:nitroreductase